MQTPIVAAYDFEPFGKELRSLSHSRKGWIGKEKDNESFLDDLGARKYDDELGRFCSVDPLLEKYPGYSTYQYAANNPISHSDPAGLDSTKLSSKIEAGTLLLAGGLLADDATIVGVTDDVLIPVVLGLGLVTTVLVKHFVEKENTNPYNGPVTTPVTVVDEHGNAIPVKKGERINASPDGTWQQVKDKDGKATGTRKDGGH